MRIFNSRLLDQNQEHQALIPVLTGINDGFQDFYFENRIESLKIDFTKYLKIIFIIFENFGKLFELLHFSGFSRVYDILPDIEILSWYFAFLFFYFLSPRQKRGSPNIDLIFNAEILSILHLMLMSFKNQFWI